MNVNQLFPSRYVKAEDLGGKEVTVTIKAVTLEDVMAGEEPKPVIAFANATKSMVLNATNAKTLTKLFGTEIDDWIGKQIILKAEEVDFRGDRVLGLRVSLRRPGEPQQANPIRLGATVARPIFTEEPPAPPAAQAQAQKEAPAEPDDLGGADIAF